MSIYWCPRLLTPVALACVTKAFRLVQRFFRSPDWDSLIERHLSQESVIGKSKSIHVVTKLISDNKILVFILPRLDRLDDIFIAILFYRNNEFRWNTCFLKLSFDFHVALHSISQFSYKYHLIIPILPYYYVLNFM